MENKIILFFKWLIRCFVIKDIENKYIFNPFNPLTYVVAAITALAIALTALLFLFFGMIYNEIDMYKEYIKKRRINQLNGYIITPEQVGEEHFTDALERVTNGMIEKKKLTNPFKKQIN